MMNERLTLGAGLLAFLTVALWGGNTVSIKIATAGLPPAAIAAVRFSLGGAVVALYALFIRLPLRLQKGETPAMIKLSLLFIVQIMLLNVGTSLTLSAHATVLISSYPFFTALFAHRLISGDRLSGGKILGMAVSFAGVAVVFGDALISGSNASLTGDLVVLASCILLGLRQVVTKRMTQGIDPVRLLFWQSAFSVPVFVLISLLFERSFAFRITPAITIAVLYQGLVVAGFCFIIITSLLKRFNASSVSSFSFFTPVFGVFMSGLLLDEPLSVWLLLSLVLITAGIVVVNRFGVGNQE
jgi:drug/metabolite transporter (DMT)-like permease